MARQRRRHRDGRPPRRTERSPHASATIIILPTIPIERDGITVRQANHPGARAQENLKSPRDNVIILPVIRIERYSE